MQNVPLIRKMKTHHALSCHHCHHDYKIIRICGSGNQESHLLAAGSTGCVPRSPKVSPEVGALPAEVRPGEGPATAMFKRLPQASKNYGLSRWHSIKESICQCRRGKRRRFIPWVGKNPWRRKWQPTPVFLPGKSHGQRGLVGYIPWCSRESDMTE